MENGPWTVVLIPLQKQKDKYEISSGKLALFKLHHAKISLTKWKWRGWGRGMEPFSLIWNPHHVVRRVKLSSKEIAPWWISKNVQYVTVLTSDPSAYYKTVCLI